MTTYFTNPLDISYRVQTVTEGRKSAQFREAADPSVVLFKDRYLMFASMVGGFWHSDDLVHWEFVRSAGLPIYDYAPDVRVIDGHVVVCASRLQGRCDFYRSPDPLSCAWEVIEGQGAFWDPNLFQDDDGRVYLYEGCSANRPIRGVELDRRTFRRIGKPVDLIASNTKERGWERDGDDWDPTMSKRSLGMRLIFGTRPFIEGAWMTKHGGRYYLQYAAPGTERNVYSDGYFIGDSPLGPFSYSPNSPFSSKPGGFAKGAGHGSTFQDKHGNWWHAATIQVSVHHNFERRIGIFPAGFDDDGVLFCNQEFADYPIALPEGPQDPWSLTGHMMLLSDGRPAIASSSRPGHGPEQACDEEIRTWWVAGSDGAEEWLQIDLGEAAIVSSVQVNTIEIPSEVSPASKESGLRMPFSRRSMEDSFSPAPFVLSGSVDGYSWSVLEDAASEGRNHQLVALADPTPLRYVRVCAGRDRTNGPFAVDGLRVFGSRNEERPSAVVGSGHRLGPLDARVDWRPVPGAKGYTVRYGLERTKLYHSWQVAAPGLMIRSLTAGQDYWFAIDAFNDGGCTRGEPQRLT